MVIITNEQAGHRKVILNYLPPAIRRLLYALDITPLEEVRLRLKQPITLQFGKDMYFITPKGELTYDHYSAIKAEKRDIDEALELITQSSVYAAEEEIRKGYITIPGGNRVGICGTAVSDNGKISFIKDINGLNYRFAREIKGVSDEIMKYICRDGDVKSTIIISPPQCGKTTLLRDIARNISAMGIKVGIIDERSEIAGINGGMSSYDLGFFTDVLDGCPKDEGMIMMLRSMSPQVIITDEIGTQGDVIALLKMINSGVRIVTSIHASSRGELLRRGDMSKLTGFFDCFITLSRREGVGTLEEVYERV
ncbi:MAG: stage III sporulation protein AA [Oscillospiraceae bacterium]|nr:stage III sporulation protein AA [Oscillospiraceae bacterium]